MTTARQPLNAAQLEAEHVVALDLPWPPADLNPNKRLHWADRRRATQQYRTDCFFVVKARGGWLRRTKVPMPLPTPVSATVTFWMPDRRRRDLDNLLAAMKPAWDGLVDAGLLADDSADQLSITLKPPQYGGRAGAGVQLELAYTGRDD